MRKKIAVGVGLVAVVLAIVGPPFVALSVRPYEPPLRVGMTRNDVESVLGEPALLTVLLCNEQPPTPMMVFIYYSGCAVSVPCTST